MKSRYCSGKTFYYKQKISLLLAIFTSLFVGNCHKIIAEEPKKIANKLEIVPVPKTVQVNKIKVINSTVFTSESFESIVEPLEGQRLTLQQLTELAARITQLYINQGYLNSRALPPTSLQEVIDGVVKIVIIEGSISEIIIEGTDRLEEYVRSRIKLSAGTPLNVPNLEDRLRLLNNDPLFDKIEASLRSGKSRNETIIVVRVRDAKPFFGSISFDNYYPPSTGPESFNLSLAYRNLTNSGDSIAISYSARAQNFDRTYDLNFSYSLPLNPSDAKLQLQARLNRSSIISDRFIDLGINAESESYALRYSQPLVRNPRQEFSFSVGFVYQDGQTFTFQGATPFGIGPDENGISRTSVFEISQDLILRQPSGAWNFRSLFRIGVDIFNATVNPNSNPDGRFFAWLAQLQRVPIITDNNFIIFQLDSQLTPNSLLPSEQFAIGGGGSLRGYRQNVRTGDNGLRFSLEDRITLVKNSSNEPVFVLAPFLDLGYVFNDPSNPNFIPSDRFLVGLGLGAIWQPINNLNLRLDFAPPLINLTDRGTNIQDDGFYFSIGYNF